MVSVAMRQHTFIIFMCCPMWRGLLTVNKLRHTGQHTKLIKVCCRIATLTIYEDFKLGNFNKEQITY
jgi:hypothetical protein